MKEKTWLLNTLLAMVLGAGLLIGEVSRAFVPNEVLPNLDITAMVAITLIALLVEYYMAGAGKRAWAVQILLAAVTFLALPWAADLFYAGVKTALCGGIVFGITTWLFDSIVKRMKVTTEGKGSLIPAAFILYLACQCFMGMI